VFGRPEAVHALRRMPRLKHFNRAGELDAWLTGLLDKTARSAYTAVVAVESARRLADDTAPGGILATAEAFDAADLLAFLGGHGVTWRTGLAEAWVPLVYWPRRTAVRVPFAVAGSGYLAC
jgi:hypothetical protein